MCLLFILSLFTSWFQSLQYPVFFSSPFNSRTVGYKRPSSQSISVDFLLVLKHLECEFDPSPFIQSKIYKRINLLGYYSLPCVSRSKCLLKQNISFAFIFIKPLLHILFAVMQIVTPILLLRKTGLQTLINRQI